MTKDWRSLRADVQQLYCVENQKLKDVMRIIEARHGFKASERSYHSQLRKWGYMKYKLHNGQRSSEKARSPSLSRSPTATGDEAMGGLLPVVSIPAAETRLNSTISAPTLSAPTTLTSHSYSDGNVALRALSRIGPVSEVVARIRSPRIADPLSSPYRADGKTDLHLAVLGQDKGKVEKALQDFSSLLDVKDALGNGALHYAAEKGVVEIVILLLDHGATVDAKGRLGKTPLHLAASYDIALLLLEHLADPTIKDANGNTPAHIAAQNSAPEMGESNTLHALIDHERCTLNTPNRLGFTPFHYVLQQHRLTLDFFLSRGASATMPFPDGRMPLEVLLATLGELKDWVVCRRWTDIICLMIELGANPDTLLPTGESLTVAYIDILPRVGDDESFDIALARTICYSADLIAPTCVGLEPGASLLHVLSKNCIQSTTSTIPFDHMFYTLFQIVLERGGDPNKEDEKGRTPLLLLLLNEKKNRDTVFFHSKQLLSHGANPWISDKDGTNAVLAAAKSPEYCGACLHYLLRNSLEAQKQMHQRLHKRSVLRHCMLQDWLSAVEADNWSEANRCLRNLRDPDLMICACKVMAEWHLENSEDWFGEVNDRKDMWRRYNAQIIRDCHKFGIRLGLDYYDYLLDLCD